MRRLVSSGTRARRFLFRVVDRHRDELEPAGPIHLPGSLEIRELAGAGRAPRRPEIDQEELAGAVLPQPLELVGARHLDRHGFGGGRRGLIRRRSWQRLDRAALDARALGRDGWPASSASIASRASALPPCLPSSIRPSSAQRARLVEDEDVGAEDDAELLRDRLILAVREIRVLELPIGGAAFISSSVSPTSE